MAKKKKKKKVQPVVPAYEPPTEGRYYWCVNCGHHGDYGFTRKRGLNCELCDYDEVSIWTLEEINDPHLDNLWLERFKKKDIAIKEREEERREFAKRFPKSDTAKTESKQKSKVKEESLCKKKLLK